MTIVHVAYEALARGSLADGEVCEIRGVGAIPLDVARRLASDSILRVLVTKGAQPMAVTPGVRTIPRALRILLEARDKVCAIRGCDVSRGLQIDHGVDFALLGPTDLENCVPLCRVHHDMKTYLGFRRVRGDDGEWILVPPDDYLDPDPPDPGIGPTLFRNPWTGLVGLDGGDGARCGSPPTPNSPCRGDGRNALREYNSDAEPKGSPRSRIRHVFAVVVGKARPTGRAEARR